LKVNKVKLTTLKNKVKAGKVKQLHTALANEYVSRKTNGYVREYQGRYGKGFALLSPNRHSNNFSFITYFV